jgi:hypothetical protein
VVKKIPALLMALNNVMTNVRKFVPGSKSPIPPGILEAVESEKEKLISSIMEFWESGIYRADAAMLILEKIPLAHGATIKIVDEDCFASEIVAKRVRQTFKAGDRMIQSAIDSYFAEALQRYFTAFDALKKRAKADIAMADASCSKADSHPFPKNLTKASDPVLPDGPEIPRARETLGKLGRVSARMQTVLRDPKKIQEGELESHSRHVDPVDTDGPEARILRGAIREKIFAIETLMRSEPTESTSGPFAVSDHEEAASEAAAPLEISPEQITILEEIRLLKQHVGNPSSTRVTNTNSFGDGHFWFNVLNPFLNFLAEHIAKNPEDAVAFDWWNIAQAYSVTFGNDPKHRNWCSTLAQETDDSGDFATEWAKFPRFVRAQLNQGMYKRKLGKEPMKILCGLLDGYFEGKAG